MIYAHTFLIPASFSFFHFLCLPLFLMLLAVIPHPSLFIFLLFILVLILFILENCGHEESIRHLRCNVGVSTVRTCVWLCDCVRTNVTLVYVMCAWVCVCVCDVCVCVCVCVCDMFCLHNCYSIDTRALLFFHPNTWSCKIIRQINHC